MPEVRFPVHGFQVDAVLVFDTDDIDELNVSSNRGFDESDDGKGGILRKPNGENTLTLRITFKNGKRETWVKPDQHQIHEPGWTGS